MYKRQDAFGALIVHRAINQETKKMSLAPFLNLAKLRDGGEPCSTTGKFNPLILRFDADADTGEIEYDPQDWHQ